MRTQTHYSKLIKSCLMIYSLNKHSSHLCTLWNIILHPLPSWTLGKKITLVTISLILEMPTYFTCHSLELKLLKNPHSMPSQQLGTLSRHILSYSQINSHSSGPLRPTYLRNCQKIKSFWSGENTELNHYSLNLILCATPPPPSPCLVCLPHPPPGPSVQRRRSLVLFSLSNKYLFNYLHGYYALGPLVENSKNAYGIAIPNDPLPPPPFSKSWS